MHPEYGGSGFTKSIGTWMRVMGIDSLIYPSARSNVSATYGENKELVSAKGWSLVDYTEAAHLPDRTVHMEMNQWGDFIGARQAAPHLVRHENGWYIEGNEAFYATMKEGLFGKAD